MEDVILNIFVLMMKVTNNLFCEGMSQQLGRGYRPPSTGYFASDRRSRGHPYRPYNHYNPYSPPLGGNTNNVFSRAARHLSQVLPAAGRSAGDWGVRGRVDHRRGNSYMSRGGARTGRDFHRGRSGW